jgi:hypothetical protein
MMFRARVLALVAAAALAGCDAGRSAIGGPDAADSVYVRITLRELPATLTFNHAHVAMHSSEYIWGITFDTDGDGTFETEIALSHYKFSDTPVERSLIDGTQHDVWERDSLGGGIVRHPNVPVRIDPTAPTTLVLALPRAWAQIGRIDESDRFYVHASFIDSTPPASVDATGIATGSGIVSDAAGDVGYGFLDIVSARWSRTP